MTPRVSVIIATRDRHEWVGRALRSVLNNAGSQFDVWVVDANPDGEPADSLRPLLNDPRVHYLRTAARGSARAHNDAIHRAVGELLAMTDDDCEVSEDWVEEMIRAFDRDPRVGVVFGNVLPADAGRTGSVGYIRKDDFLARTVGDKAGAEGVWACMGLRRQTWSALKGFDERFGFGASFPGSGDSDLAIRALAAGYFVFETPRLSVLHHRVLPPDLCREAVEQYSYASGALMAKHLKCRTHDILKLLSALASRWVRGSGHSVLMFGNQSYRWRRLGAFLRGVLRGTVTPIDATSGQYERADRGEVA